MKGREWEKARAGMSLDMTMRLTVWAARGLVGGLGMMGRAAPLPLLRRLLGARLRRPEERVPIVCRM